MRSLFSGHRVNHARSAKRDKGGHVDEARGCASQTVDRGIRHERVLLERDNTHLRLSRESGNSIRSQGAVITYIGALFQLEPLCGSIGGMAAKPELPIGKQVGELEKQRVIEAVVDSTLKECNVCGACSKAPVSRHNSKSQPLRNTSIGPSYAPSVR
jgi:hypothetical protein